MRTPRIITQTIEKAINGDENAIEELIIHYEPNIIRWSNYWANKYKNDIEILDLDDLMQAGRIGVYKASQRCTLETFSHQVNFYISGSIQRELAENCRTITIPIKVWDEKYSKQNIIPNLTLNKMFLDSKSISLEDFDENDLLVDDDFSEELLKQYLYEISIDSIVSYFEKHKDNVLFTNADRLIDIAFEYFVNEKTYKEIGFKHNLSVERVRQCVERFVKLVNRLCGEDIKSQLNPNLNPIWILYFINKMHTTK